MKNKLRIIIVMGVLALASLPACTEEVAVLRNGYSIRHVRHELRGDITRLYLTEAAGSYVEVATEEIERFEELEAPLPAVSVVAVESPEGAAKSPTVESDVKQAIETASSRNRIDPDLIESMIRAESGFNANAVSRKGAQGLMQLMPATAARLGVGNAMDLVANVEGGTRYLVELLALYNDDLIKALAAYNAGPKRVEQYRGVPPYTETRAYVTKVITNFNRKKIAQRGTQPAQGKKAAVQGVQAP
jgi:soluble lytic murein transglycosylase-like protein